MAGSVSVSSASADSPTPLSPVTSPLVSRTGRERQRAAGAAEGGWEILMVTNKNNDSLIFPKGGWETDETAEQAAARETMEEAGARGDVVPLGDFAFDSKMKDGKKTPCKCSVFVMNVTEEMEAWPEQSTRQRRWCTPTHAVASCKHEWMRDAIKKWGEGEGLKL